MIPTSKANFAEQILADTRVLRIILRQIAEDTDFLLEAKLMNLLKPYISENNERIVEIDNVFKVCISFGELLNSLYRNPFLNLKYLNTYFFIYKHKY